MALRAKDVLSKLPVDLAGAPLGLFINMLTRRWQVRGALRRPINDPQIFGYGLCILGALCEAWREIPEADAVSARWAGWKLEWMEDGEKLLSNPTGPDFLPKPVAEWWDKNHHSVLSSEDLNKLAPIANDYSGWNFDQFSVLLATRFGVNPI